MVNLSTKKPLWAALAALTFLFQVEAGAMVPTRGSAASAATAEIAELRARLARLEKEQGIELEEPSRSDGHPRLDGPVGNEARRPSAPSATEVRS